MSSNDISRDELLLLLSSMGVVLAKDNKLPTEELNRRFGMALNTAQELSDVVDKTPINLASLPRWTSQKTLFDATKRGSLTEALVGYMSQPKKGYLSPKEEIFKEMRQSVLLMAHVCDVGLRDICFLTEGDELGIFVRIMDVLRIKDGVPLYYFVYRELVPTPDTPMDALIDGIGVDRTLIKTGISDLERRTLLRLFRKNTKKLDPKIIAMERDAQGKETGHHPSFVLPLCPIAMRNLGKLTNNPGCEVCGKKNTSRCMQCMSVVYCSKQCQKEHWQTHKETCKSIKGGTWHSITVQEPDMGPPELNSIVNRLESMHNPQTAGISPSNNGIPPDVHGGKVFLAKFQVSLTYDNYGILAPDMLVYDRTRSFRFFWKRRSNPRLFAEAQKMMGSKLKFYRAPREDPLW
ncbi:Ankyrin repeat and MYND domain-containing protein 2 [Psilocybe cubensis]|uniref:Ankyrin repeat and MYND domain-containing protein 2 n=1 Tax=Psilocybe cubensis TaxID=181762 RepID=A0ACB8GTZ1_PSICU|nr:Ankyrin repeat and MYND domain-containing protein 2 [Psilocybe cubensis]KAH9479136.1 Ankyrin repeat and MYND domain-containing protein 2 [Psilocybe cubensis]